MPKLGVFGKMVNVIVQTPWGPGRLVGRRLNKDGSVSRLIVEHTVSLGNSWVTAYPGYHCGPKVTFSYSPDEVRL